MNLTRRIRNIAVLLGSVAVVGITLGLLLSLILGGFVLTVVGSVGLVMAIYNHADTLLKVWALVETMGGATAVVLGLCGWEILKDFADSSSKMSLKQILNA